MKIATGRTLVIAVLVPAGSFPVYAQSEKGSQVLEEVIVTATKRASNLQDVAVTVTALGAELLQAAQVNSAAEQTFVVSSLNVQRGGDGVHFITGL